MTKTEFITWLQTLQSDGDVLIFNPDVAEWCAVTGATYDEREIKLYDDEVC